MLQGDRKRMSKEHLSKEQLYFARVAIVCVEYLKKPLIDILRSFIEPQNLCEEIRKCNRFMLSLHPKQKEKCGLNQSGADNVLPDYCSFDVTLLSALMESCTSVKADNKDLWKAIKKIRDLKNDFSHATVARLDKEEFDSTWSSIRRAIKNCQTLAESLEYHSDCLDEFDKLKHETIDRKTYTSYTDKLRGKFLVAQSNAFSDRYIVPYNCFSFGGNIILAYLAMFLKIHKIKNTKLKNFYVHVFFVDKNKVLWPFLKPIYMKKGQSLNVNAHIVTDSNVHLLKTITIKYINKTKHDYQIRS